MPQGLVRTDRAQARPLEVDGQELPALHDLLAGILRSRLGSNHAEWLAHPRRAADGSIQWQTGLTGPAVRADSLADADRLALQRKAERVVRDIRDLAAALRLESGGGSSVADQLEAAVQFPPGPWLYSVDGRAVQVLWGHGDPGAPAPPPHSTGPASAPPSPPAPPPRPASAPSPSSAPASGPAAATSPSPSPGPSTTPPTRSVSARPAASRARWVAAALAVAALLLLAIGLARFSPDPQALDARVAELDAANAELAQRLLRQRSTLMQCGPDTPSLADRPGPQGQASPPTLPPPPPSPSPPAGPLDDAPAPGVPRRPSLPEMPAMPAMPASPASRPGSGDVGRLALDACQPASFGAAAAVTCLS